jgi:hypothetical protein
MYLVLPDDGSAKPKHVGKYIVASNNIMYTLTVSASS